ncbi:unnamed protein product, partial [Rotaria sp. Silwood2]
MMKLTTAYEHGVVSYYTVTRWIQRFSNERESLEDNPRSCYSITAFTQQNIDVVTDLKKKIKVMAHPPYSSDLAPSDFWLFNRLKRSLDTYPVSTSLAT